MPPKRIIIKPLKAPPRLSPTFEADHWALLERAIDLTFAASRGDDEDAPLPLGSGRAAHTQRVLKAVGRTVQLERVYRACEGLCQHGFAEQTLGRLKARFKAHAATATDAMAAVAARASSSESSLAAVVEGWDAYAGALGLLRHLLGFLDRTHIMAHTAHGSLEAIAAEFLALALEPHQAMLAAAVQGFLQHVADERRGNAGPRRRLASFRDLLVALRKYYSDLEPLLLRDTEAFYSAEGAELVLADKISAADFVAHVERRVREEHGRSDAYLEQQTRPKLDERVQQLLVAEHYPQVVSGGLRGLIQAESTTALKALYRFAHLRFVRRVDVLRKAYRDCIVALGTELVQAKGLEDQLVSGLLQLKELVGRVLASAFDGNASFSITMREAFEQVIRLKQNQAAELLARHVDGILREGSGLVESQAEEMVAASMELFALMPAKDLFEALYARDLAKRLLLSRSSGPDLERFTIDRLKAICGASLAVKLNGMIHDLDASRELQAAAKESGTFDVVPQEATDEDAAAPAAAPIDMTVHVLTMSFWPTYDDLTPALPPLLLGFMERFAAFYKTKHASRRLKWQHALSHAVVRGKFAKGRKDFVVSFLQALVLIAFNAATEITYGDLKQTLGVPDGPDLTCALISLYAGSAKVLRRTKGSAATTAPGGLADDDMLALNTDFTHRLLKIRVAQVQLKEASEENKATVEKVFAERQYVVDACIVRFMKSRRRASHTELVAEVTQMLKFPVQPTDLKRRVEVLMERDYMERDAEDPAAYVYVA